MQPAMVEIRRGKKKGRKKKPQGKNIMSTSAMQGGHKTSFVIHVTVSKLIASFVTKVNLW